ncbi:hypothetical protein [Enterococcus sp. AZ109]|uniref:hypothetical protein n=1 Tax=Enterococcus sp. AZ109 TaxID=2774634 RepID=UPI003F202524
MTERIEILEEGEIEPVAGEIPEVQEGEFVEAEEHHADSSIKDEYDLLWFAYSKLVKELNQTEETDINGTK